MPYVPPSTTFLLTNDNVRNISGQDQRSTSNPHWNIVRDTITKRRGFAVPEKTSSNAQSKHLERRRRQSFPVQNRDAGKTPAKNGKYVTLEQNGGPVKNDEQSRPPEINNSRDPMQSEEFMVFAEQPSHFAVPDQNGFDADNKSKNISFSAPRKSIKQEIPSGRNRRSIHAEEPMVPLKQTNYFAPPSERRSRDRMSQKNKQYTVPGQTGNKRRDEGQKKMQELMQAEKPMTILKQPNHFAAPERTFNELQSEGKDSSNNRSSNNNAKKKSNSSINNKNEPLNETTKSSRPGQHRVPVGPETEEDSNGYQNQNSNSGSQENAIENSSGKRPLGRTTSVYDPEHVIRRAEMIENSEDPPSKVNGQNDAGRQTGRDMGMKNGVVDTGVKRLQGDDVGIGEFSGSDGRRNEGSTEKYERDYGTNSLNSEGDSMYDSDSDSSAGSSPECVENDCNKPIEKQSFFKKCAPSFAKKIVDAIEKKKHECQLCLDDLAAKHKKMQMEKGKPIFTSYSCENGTSDDDFRSTIKRRMSSLVGGFYCKACTGMQVLAALLEEEHPENDGTWTGIEGEHGVRCVPLHDNFIEDHTMYICSCCFNEECDRNRFVSTKFLGEIFGCCAPVFVSRSFENRPAHCEKMLQRMGESRRNLFLKMVGKKAEMKGGVRCNSKVEIKEEETKNLEDAQEEHNEMS